MTRSAHIVNVPLGGRSYPIYIGNGLLEEAGKYFLRHRIGRTVIIVTDKNIAPKHLAVLTRSLEAQQFTVRSIVLPPGEEQKSIIAAETIFTQLLRWNIERGATIAALGGGVIGDLAGFVAATYLRGIGFVQIPTTLLAQVDSSIGGKVGINHALAKNMIGAFYQPAFVLADTSVLSTLPKRERISGMGEIVKYGIILDSRLFEFIEHNMEKALTGDQTTLTFLVRRCCELKANIVSRDEKESDVRAILNFGHTVGHALEHSGRYGFLKHGEAILYGIIAETHIANEMKLISSKEKERIEQMIQRIPIPSLTPLKLRYASIAAVMKKDKKVKDGAIRMTLPMKIGKVTMPMAVAERLVLNAVKHVKVYGA